jgi:hypothetical protein
LSENELVFNDYSESGELLQGLLNQFVNRLDWTMYGAGSELYVKDLLMFWIMLCTIFFGKGIALMISFGGIA